MQIIVAAGRSQTVEEFVSEIFKLLYNGFKIIGCHSLGEPGVDHKERFLCLISGDETEFDFDTQAERLKHSGEYGAKVFDSLEDALTYSQDEYELSADTAESYIKYEELVEEFPEIRAVEKEQWMVLDAFIKLGRVTVVPAKLDGERAIAIVSVTHGPDELRVTPLAILCTDEIVSLLELPGENS
jgi:hypothetical protein